MGKYLFGLFVMAWFGASLWWYGSYKKCISCLAEQTLILQKAPNSGFLVIDSNWNEMTASNFKFEKKSSKPIINEEMASLLTKVTSYVKNNDHSKILVINGLFKNEEKAGNLMANLGLERANELKKWFVYNRGLQSKNIMTTGEPSDNLVAISKDTLVGGIQISFKPVEIVTPKVESLAINDISNNVNINAPMVVYLNDKKLPGNEAFLNYLEAVKKYLHNHNEKKLLIAGYTNLKITRKNATMIREELYKKGISENQLELIADQKNTNIDGQKNAGIIFQIQ